MALADFSVRRAVAASMMVLICIVLGAVSYFRIPVDILPDLTFPVAAVIIEYEGVGPEEIEQTITKPAEEALSRTDGVKNLYSTAARGRSLTVVEFEWGTDMNTAVIDVREKLDQIPDFLWPEDADRPRIQKFDPADIPLMGIAVYGGGNDVHQLQQIAEDYVADTLVGVEGVASLSVFGGPPRQVLIAVDQDRLSAHNLALQTVLERLHTENYNVSAGSLKEGHKDYLVRALGEFTNIDEIEAVVLGMAGGAPIRIRDVATVVDTYADAAIYARDNGEPSVMCMLTKQSGSNTVQVSKKVWARVAEIETQLPPGVHLLKTFDTADFINEAIANVRGNLLWGGCLAILVLAVFLRRTRPVLIIAVAIPISLFTALVPMFFFGTTINMMSLGGLALATGMLVDNAIVVLENIFRRQEEEGEHRMDAARRGARQVTAAITGSTLTTVAVFLPIAFTQGYASRLFRDLALTVSFALGASLFTALTLVPMLASRVLDARHGRVQTSAPMHRVTDSYRRIVERIVANRWKVFIAGNLFWLASVLILTVIGKEFMPTPNDITVMINIELPQGVRIEETDRIASLVEGHLARTPEVVSVHAIIGLDAGSDELDSKQATFILTLSGQKERERTVGQIVDDVRQRVTAIPGVREFNFINLQSQSMGGSGAKPIQVKIFGRDLRRLTALSQDALDRLRRTPSVLDPEEGLTYGDPEVQITFDRERAAQLGLPISVVADLLEAAIKGKTASRYRSGGEEYDIVVRLIESNRDSLPALNDMHLLTSTGARARLSDIAQVGYGSGPTEIYRENQKRAAVLAMNHAEDVDLDAAVQDIQAALADLPLPPGYFIEYGGQYKNMRETFVELGFAAALAVLLVYMIMAAQFESLVLPFAIMFSIPFAFVGSLWALLLTGTTLSAISGIGTILLAGIVVNNGIVLIDYANQCHQSGMTREEALIKACVTRLRPILMTSLTTILALVPMATLGGAGFEMRRPLAISVMGGLAFGVVLTLVLLPAGYLILGAFGARVAGRVTHALHGDESQVPGPVESPSFTAHDD